MTDPVELQAQSDVDPRPRLLLERYLALSGGSITYATTHLAHVTLDKSDAKNFGTGVSMVVAFTPDAIDDNPDAVLLTTGSELLRTLLSAIQRRGSLDDRGLIDPVLARTATESAPPARLDGAAIKETVVKDTYRRVGRLMARVTMHAGPSMVERLLETELIDLNSGGLLDQEVVTQLLATSSNSAGQADTDQEGLSSTLQLLMGRLADNATPEIDLLQRESDVALRSELGRLSSYYEKLIADAEESSAADDDIQDRKAAIRADRDRRKKEEEFRFSVRVSVHPVQLTQWRVPAEEVCWTVATEKGREAQISSSRILLGEGKWELSCPSCAEPIRTINVCRHKHVSCANCASFCATCGEACCAGHGASECHVGKHPTCDEHGTSCRSCEQTFCDAHSGRCEANDHSVCAECAVQCSRCNRGVCKAHGVQSAANSTREARWLCAACTVLCEGGQDEPVGLDEVTRCASCRNYICVEHQATCAVDGLVHCSRHLRRSDRTGRLLCEKHRAECADEPRSVLGTDEVSPCNTCGRTICDEHGGVCGYDNALHCRGHLKQARGQNREFLCETHRVECSVDAAIHRLEDVTRCPVCDKPSCEDHKALCKHCGRRVCSRDLDAQTCKTCRRLLPTGDPVDALIQAGLTANGGEPIRSGTWSTSQDARHTVVEVNQGWSRKLVFAVRHGESSPSTIVRHSLLGSKRVK